MLFHVAIGNKRLEDDQSAIAYNLVAVNVIYVIAAVETALTVYQALFRADYITCYSCKKEGELCICFLYIEIEYL